MIVRSLFKIPMFWTGYNDFSLVANIPDFGVVISIAMDFLEMYDDIILSEPMFLCCDRPAAFSASNSLFVTANLLFEPSMHGTSDGDFTCCVDVLHLAVIIAVSMLLHK